MTDLSKAEAEITRLCEIAEAKGDWVFKPWSLGDGVTCGCPLQLAARELGFGHEPESWIDAGDALGVEPGDFGIAFDRVARGDELNQEWLLKFQDKSIGLMAERLARRFVHKEGVSDA